MTNEQRAAWLEGRRTGIGGSDVAAVLGLNPWKTPLDVWNDKLGLSEDKGMTEPAYWGTVLEDTVAKEFQLRTGKKVQKVSHQFADPETPWAIANIDRAIINPEIAKKSGRCLMSRKLSATQISRALSDLLTLTSHLRQKQRTLLLLTFGGLLRSLRSNSTISEPSM